MVLKARGQMRIEHVEAFPVRLPRQSRESLGTAGSPTRLQPGANDYRWSETVTALYSVNFESALVRVACDNGLEGWGEAQAPLAPEVACAIVNLLLKPVVEGAEFGGSVDEIGTLWRRMFSAMRVRGHSGGFMMDAISGVDIALWDLAGKIRGVPACRLMARETKSEIPAYLSGVGGGAPEERAARARAAWDEGFRTFKLFYDCASKEFWRGARAVRAALGPQARIAIDALWRLTPEEAATFGRECDGINALWLEAPLMPEDPLEHGRLAAAIETPLALGESYRTVFELRPFFDAAAVTYVQPDLGRCGITEGLRIAELVWEMGKPLVPHLSIALGPQIAAAVHYAAACGQCEMLEYNPAVLEMANRFLAEPIPFGRARYQVPEKPGLGVEVREAELQAACGLA
jgi:galactonate dehydratase